MIVTYNIRKISIQDISKRKYDVKMLGKKDERYFIQQQNNHAFRQIKQVLQNKKYIEIYNLNQKIKQINKKYNREIDQDKKTHLFNKILKLKNQLKDIQRMDEMIFLQSPKKNKKSLIKVLKSGFYYNGEKYIRFGKSASQAKQGVTVFIRQKYYDEMLERSQLGIKVKKCVISKYEAYRNLILSACEFAEMELPNIVIVDDFAKTIPNQYIRYVEKEDVEYIDKKTKEKKIYKGKKVVKESYKDIEIEPFDGMGIHTKEIGEKWAKAINLKYIPISYQVRIPFMKGMSTQAPIKEIYKEWGITEITDMFGYKHKVEDIDCIWTKSMWKGCGIFKDEFGNEAFNEYMNRLRKYNYCMGFSKYSHRADHMQLYTKMNFQYLQCLDLWNKKYIDYFEKRKAGKEVEYYDFLDENNYGKVTNIAKYSTDLIEKIMNDDKLYTYKFLGISDTSYTNVESKMLKAMLINEDMFYDSCIKNMLKRQLNKTINQMKYGKVFAKGFYHIVVGDIKGLLEYAAGLEVKGCLKEREMYSAEMEKGKCLSMRSPLVDPSEINKVTMTSNEWIDEYLGYFKGSDVVMINLYDISLPQQGGINICPLYK